MKTHLDCIPCFQKQALNATRFVTDDVELQERILRRVIHLLADMDWRTTPPEMAHGVHRIVLEGCNYDDPYKNVKKRDNDIVLKWYSDLKAMVQESEEPVQTAALLSIAGNVIDYGVGVDIKLEETISRAMEKGLTVDDNEAFHKSLKKAKKLALLADNAGEIVFDKLMLETILEYYKIDNIIIAIKGAPIINDATREDAVHAGLDKIPGVEFFRVGTGIPGSGAERNSKEFRDMLDGVDMVISKGQGNYEALSEEGGIFFLLMAKCPVVADDLGVPVGSFILKEVR